MLLLREARELEPAMRRQLVLPWVCICRRLRAHGIDTIPVGRLAHRLLVAHTILTCMVAHTNMRTAATLSTNQATSGHTSDRVAER